ncbi:hypothetical protein FB451DRAFT_1366947 [Mycena latifolia]|nr:hypothetical protein FB451DRAFT_1366947 [Mycena latifolia]
MSLTSSRVTLILSSHLDLKFLVLKFGIYVITGDKQQAPRRARRDEAAASARVVGEWYTGQARNDSQTTIQRHDLDARVEASIVSYSKSRSGEMYMASIQADSKRNAAVNRDPGFWSACGGRVRGKMKGEHMMCTSIVSHRAGLVAGPSVRVGQWLMLYIERHTESSLKRATVLHVADPNAVQQYQGSSRGGYRRRGCAGSELKPSSTSAITPPSATTPPSGIDTTIVHHIPNPQSTMSGALPYRRPLNLKSSLQGDKIARPLEL